MKFIAIFLNPYKHITKSQVDDYIYTTVTQFDGKLSGLFDINNVGVQERTHEKDGQKFIIQSAKYTTYADTDYETLLKVVKMDSTSLKIKIIGRHQRQQDWARLDNAIRKFSNYRNEEEMHRSLAKYVDINLHRNVGDVEPLFQRDLCMSFRFLAGK